MPERKNPDLEKLPPVDMAPPKIRDVPKDYGEIPFDAELDGFSGVLKFADYLPYRKSADVKASPLGIGYEVIDARKGYDFSKTLPIMENSGVKWARVQSGWSRAETEKGVYDFSWLDEIVDGLIGIGIQPWISMCYGNPIYMYRPNQQASKAYAFPPNMFNDDSIVRAWKNYSRATAVHYKERVQYWEIWNEPNAGFWRNPDGSINPDPGKYVELIRITSGEIKAVQPAAKIIGGSISGGGCCNHYIKGLVEAGIAGHIDIFTYHPYGMVPELYVADRLAYIKRVFSDAGKDMEFWQGECGRPSGYNKTGKGWKYTTANQARYLTRRILTDLRLGFKMSSYHLAADIVTGDPQVPFYTQGVIDATGDEYRPKPSFFALQSMAYLFDSDTKPMVSNLEVYPQAGWSRSVTPVAGYNAITCGFRRGDVPIYAYYYPEAVDIDSDIKRVMISLYVEEGLRLDNPVLIDPVTRKVYRFTKPPKPDSNDLRIFIPMPLLDYPLFITDLSIACQ